MRIDDIWTYIVANNASYMAALSTVSYPLITLTDAMRLDDPEDQLGNLVGVYLFDNPEEVEVDAPGFRIVSFPVDIYVFTTRETDDKNRNKARLYAEGILNCLKAYPDFFTLTGRDYWWGKDGNRDITAAKISVVFKYEE